MKTEKNLVDLVWKDYDKPDPLRNEVTVQDFKYAGKKRSLCAFSPSKFS